MLDIIEHPLIKEWRQMCREKMPNFLAMVILFEWDEGIYVEEFSKYNKEFDIIVGRLSEASDEDQAGLDLIRQELMGLLNSIEPIYRILVNSLSEEDLKKLDRTLGNNGS